jgi:hypothetical protein
MRTKQEIDERIYNLQQEIRHNLNEIEKAKDAISSWISINVTYEAIISELQWSLETKEEVPAIKPSKLLKPFVCPHDHKFGIDTDKYDDCKECNIWNYCVGKKEKIENGTD